MKKKTEEVKTIVRPVPEPASRRPAARDLMSAYMADISAEALIDEAEERRLAEIVRQGTPGERIAARNLLIRANLRLVVKIAHDFQNRGLPLSDLVTEGNLGLVRAAERFLPDKGAKFSTYSAWWICQSMLRALADQVSVIRVPVQAGARMAKITAAERQLNVSLGRTPSDAEIAEHLKFPVRTVTMLRHAVTGVVSLDARIIEGEDGTFADLVPDRTAVSPDDRCDARDAQARVRQAFRRLSDRERQVLRLRFRHRQTLEEVSRRVGRTRERVRQIQTEALEKLRMALDGQVA